MTRSKRRQVAAGFMLAVATVVGTLVTGSVIDVPAATAVPSTQEYQQKVQQQSQLKSQLAGVSKDLADQILALNDLTDNQIPEAQAASDAAADKAEQAKDVAAATNERLKATQKDKTDLEAKIAQTGDDYDDATEAVANLARSSFHGSDASDVMEVVTNSSTTQDFVNNMQAESAVTRSEANAANDAANVLSTSMNRKQRLAAIEEQITALKRQADADAASAQQASAAAAQKQSQLEALRTKGDAARAALVQQESSLKTQSAKEAAQIVAMKSQIDSYNEQLAAQKKPDPSAGGSQYTGGNANASTGGGNNAGSAGGGSSSGSGGTQSGGGVASGMNYAVPGSCPEGSRFCYGHNTGNTVGGSAYPSMQCTLWAYIRRSQMGLPVGSYMGNATNWASSARQLGYVVNTTPHVGAVMVFHAGQLVTSWRAHALYGHVAVVERVNSDGSVLISEGGTRSNFPSSEIVSNASSGRFTYIHY